MAEDPKNPFSGPLGARNMGAKGRKGASGGGNLRRDIGRALSSKLKRDKELEEGVGKAMHTSVKRHRTAEGRFDKLEDKLLKLSKGAKTGGRF